MENCKFENIKFIKTDLKKIKFKNCSMKNVDFNNCDLFMSNFIDISLVNTQIYKSNIFFIKLDKTSKKDIRIVDCLK